MKHALARVYRDVGKHQLLGRHRNRQQRNQQNEECAEGNHLCASASSFFYLQSFFLSTERLTGVRLGST
jgi:hypothetical protein